MEKQHKEFDAVAWVRQVRDAKQRQYKDLPTQEFVQKLSEEGRQTELWQRLRQRHGRPDKAA